VVFFQSVLLLLFLGLPAPFYITTPTAPQFMLLAASAVCTVAALLLLSWAYAHAQVQYLVPLEYTAFLWATLLGFYLFGDQITGPVIVGTAFIVAGCLMATWQRKS
jgi:S-adenosylmethionine uptake transporter